MARKPKFKPVITRVKLNPEQAVLTCACHTVGYQHGTATAGFRSFTFVTTCDASRGLHTNIFEAGCFSLGSYFTFQAGATVS